MPKYNPGDRVRVKQDLTLGLYGPHKLGCARDMAALHGEILTVSKTNHLNKNDWFSVETYDWIWCEDMVEPVSQKKISLTEDDVERIKSASDAFFDLI